MTPKQLTPASYDCAGMGAAEMATWLRGFFMGDDWRDIRLVIGSAAHKVTGHNWWGVEKGLLIAAELEETRDRRDNEG